MCVHLVGIFEEVYNGILCLDVFPVAIPTNHKRLLTLANSLAVLILSFIVTPC